MTFLLWNDPEEGETVDFERVLTAKFIKKRANDLDLKQKILFSLSRRLKEFLAVEIVAKFRDRFTWEPKI